MPKKNGGAFTPDQIPAFDTEDSSLVQVVIETPKGSRNKYAYDPEHRVFELKKVLPAGLSFPYDFGFVPSTRGEDGDPLDVLVLMEEPVPLGCLVKCRLLGVIEGEQHDRENPEGVRNDRIVAVEHNDHRYAQLKNLQDVDPKLLEELGEFFATYQRLRGGKFRVIGNKNASVARKLIEKSLRKQR